MSHDRSVGFLIDGWACLCKEEMVGTEGPSPERVIISRKECEVLIDGVFM